MPAYNDDLLSLAKTVPTKIVHGAKSWEQINRLCGDKITIAPCLVDHRVTDFSWHAEGCTILKASAALLAHNSIGKNTLQLAEYLRAFRNSFSANPSEFKSGPLMSVYALPSRYKCALLPYEALENFLRDSQ